MPQKQPYAGLVDAMGIPIRPSAPQLTPEEIKEYEEELIRIGKMKNVIAKETSIINAINMIFRCVDGDPNPENECDGWYRGQNIAVEMLCQLFTNALTGKSEEDDKVGDKRIEKVRMLAIELYKKANPTAAVNPQTDVEPGDDNGENPNPNP